MGNNPNEEQLEIFHNLSFILQEKIFKEKTLSKETMKKLLTPMQNMNWKNKASYGKKLIVILGAAETEDEILQRVAKIVPFTYKIRYLRRLHY